VRWKGLALKITKKGWLAMKHNVLLVLPTIQPNGVKYLEENSHVRYAPDGQKETLIRYINENQTEAVVTRSEQIDREIMDASPSLKVIAQHGVGLDNIDVQEATRHGIKVLNVPDGNYISVAEHTMAFILALSRSLRINDCSVRRDAWYSRENRYTMEVFGKNLLIVGLGRIGRAVAERAKAFGMQVTAYDGFVPAEDMEKLNVEKAASLEDGLKKADFVTLHVPLTAETLGMMSAEQFKVMKSSAYIINMGRGPVVDEEALIQALQESEIAGAGLDVLSVEPPKADNPLFSMDQVIFTPHIGGDTREAKMRTSEILSRSVIDALDGMEVYNQVNKF